MASIFLLAIVEDNARLTRHNPKIVLPLKWPHSQKPINQKWSLYVRQSASEKDDCQL